MNLLLPFFFRLLAPILIIYYPFWGSIVATFTDSIDVVIWNFLEVDNLSSFYNFADKALDSYMYLFMGYVAYKFKNKIVRKTALFLLVYRLLGSLLYELTGFRYLLFIFPNVFAIYFITYTGIKAYIKADFIKSNNSNLKLLILTGLPKLLQEYIFHVAQFNVFRFFLEFIV